MEKLLKRQAGKMPYGLAAKLLQVISKAVEAGELGDMMGNITWIIGKYIIINRYW